MKTALFFAFLVVALGNISFSQITSGRVLKGENNIVYELSQGDCIVAIPHSFKSPFIGSGDNGEFSTDNIAISIYCQESPSGYVYRNFVPYKFSQDTLWIIIPTQLNNKIKTCCDKFQNIINPARIEIWNDTKIAGDLRQKHPQTDQGWDDTRMVSFISLLTGDTSYENGGTVAIFNANKKLATEYGYKKRLVSKIKI